MGKRRHVLDAFLFHNTGDQVNAIDFDSPGLNQP